MASAQASTDTPSFDVFGSSLADFDIWDDSTTMGDVTKEKFGCASESTNKTEASDSLSSGELFAPTPSFPPQKSDPPRIPQRRNSTYKSAIRPSSSENAGEAIQSQILTAQPSDGWDELKSPPSPKQTGADNAVDDMMSPSRRKLRRGRSRRGSSGSPHSLRRKALSRGPEANDVQGTSHRTRRGSTSGGSPTRRSPHSMRKRASMRESLVIHNSETAATGENDNGAIGSVVSPFRRSPHNLRKKASIRCLAAYNTEGVDDGHDSGSSMKMSPSIRAINRKSSFKKGDNPRSGRFGKMRRTQSLCDSTPAELSESGGNDGKVSRRSSTSNVPSEALPIKENMKERKMSRRRSISNVPSETLPIKENMKDRKTSRRRSISNAPSEALPKTESLQAQRSFTRSRPLRTASSKKGHPTKVSEKKQATQRRNSMVATINRAPTSSSELPSRTPVSRSVSMNARSLTRTTSCRGGTRRNSFRKDEQPREAIQMSTSFRKIWASEV